MTHPERGWQTNFNAAAKRVKEIYQDCCVKTKEDLDKIVKKYSRKSPRQDFLKERAYKWLQHIQAEATRKKTAPCWFPHLAIKVAFIAFRLNGKLDAFEKYLENPSRRKMLEKILPSSGWFVFAPWPRRPFLCFTHPRFVLICIPPTLWRF